MIVVEHNCDEPGCDKHELQYETSKEQIQALIQLSETCSQSIDFGCFLAPLKDEDTAFGWWLDKSGKYASNQYMDSFLRLVFFSKGNQHYFFDGNHVGEHVCSCAEDNSCLDNGGPPKDCNCDAKQPDWASDYGIITAKVLLCCQSLDSLMVLWNLT